MSLLAFAGGLLARLGLDVNMANHTCLEMHKERMAKIRKMQLLFAVVRHKTQETLN